MDDSPYFINVAREFLQMRQSFEVCGIALDGQTAIDEARRLKPDIILLDLNLGSQSGMKLIPLFKKDSPSAKVIILTIMDGEGYQSTAMKEGADAFVLKTRMTEELISRIHEVLEEKMVQENSENQPAVKNSPLWGVVERSGDLIFRYEFIPKRGFTYVNPAATVLTGYSPQEFYEDPELGTKLIHPQDGHSIESAVQDKNNLNGPVTLRWIRKDGRVIWMEQNMVSIFDEVGELVAYEGIARDITARKAVEDVRHSDEERYRILSEASNDMIFLLEPDGVINYINRFAAGQFNQSPDDLIGKRITEIFPAEVATRQLANIEQTLELGEPLFMEGLVNLRFKPIWLGSWLTPIRTERGEAVLVVSRDISDHKHAEEMLEKRADEFAALYEIALEISGQNALSELLATVTARAAKLLGVRGGGLYLYDEAEKILEVVASTDVTVPIGAKLQLGEGMAGRVAQTRQPMIVDDYGLWEFRAPKYDGIPFKSILEVPLLYGGRLIGVLAAYDIGNADRRFTDEDARLLSLLASSVAGVINNARELSVRVQVEKNLEEAEAKYRTLVEQIPAVTYLWELGERGACHFVSPRIETILGFSVEEWLADPELFFRQVHPDDRELAIAAENHSRDTGKPVNSEFRMLTRDGRIIWVSDEATVLPAEAGQPQLMHGVLTDITWRKQGEDERKRLLNMLEASLNEIYIFDPVTLKFQYANTGAISNLGYSLEQLKEMTPLDIKPEFTEETFRELIEPLLRGEKVQLVFETSHRRADGVHYPVEVHLQLVENADQNVFLAVILDITSRKRDEEQIHRRVVELEALYQSGITLSQTHDPQEIGEKIVEVLTQHLEWHHAAVRVRRGDGQELELLGFGHAEGRGEERRIQSAITRVGQGMVGWVIQHGEVLRSHNLEADPRYVATYAGMKSGLYVPIKLQDRTIGCISAESGLENAFTAQDERLLSTLAVQAAVALENARLFQEQQREILDHKRTANALSESQGRYQSLLDQLPAIVYLDDARTSPPRTEFVSPRLQDILGYSPEEWVAGGHELWVQSIHEDDRDRVLSLQQESIQNSDTFALDYRMIARDGRMVWVQDTAAIQRDENGQAISLQGVVYDITEIKNSETALRLQSAVLEAADNAIVITDTSGIFLWVNDAFERLTGYSPEETIGKTPNILSSGKQDDRFYRDMWDTILAGRVWHGEMVNKRKDGSLYHEEMTITPLKDPTGGLTHFIGMKQDITSRKQAEETLRQQVERLTALQEIDRAIASTFDMKISLKVMLSKTLNLLKADAASVWLLNTASNTLEYIAGIGFQSNIPETTKIPLSQSYAGKAVQERRVIQIQNLAHNGNNQLLAGLFKRDSFVSYYGIPLIVKGLVIGVVEIFTRSFVKRDEDWLNFLEILAREAAIAIDNAQLFSAAQRELAERRMAEEKLRISHAELEKRVEEKTTDVRRVNFELQRALRVKDEFLANMSHELRTPLNAVIGLSESLVEQTVGTLNEKQSKYASIIRESGQHLLDLINDILDLAKIEAGQITLNRENMDVATVSQASLRMVKQLAMKKHQEVLFELDPNLGMIYADERRVKQMLVNLLSNAVKFTSENGRIGLNVVGDRENNVVSFTVWDTGIGIHEDNLDRLFKPFVQLDADLDRRAGGTGLGLALVAKMAGMHGGGVSVESTPGAGSRFTIKLPWETAALADTPPRHTLENAPMATVDIKNKDHTILLVEDNEDILLLVRDYLEYVGFKVVVALNGVEGIEQAEAIKPSLILMDVQMPVLDGLEATRRIRENPALASTPIFALTALAMKGDRERCLEAGMTEYVSTPLNLKSLAELIQGYLNDSKQVMSI